MLEERKGARSGVVLTRAQDSVPAANQPKGESNGAGRVLLVDDEEAVRRTTARLLKSLGYEVLLAENGAQALEIARAHAGELDILLCDVTMPEHSGPEVAKQIQSVSPGIRVLFVSGYPESEENGVSCAGFLQKPFTRAALDAKLAALRS